MEGPWLHYLVPHRDEGEDEEHRARRSREQGWNYRVVES